MEKPASLEIANSRRLAAALGMSLLLLTGCDSPDEAPGVTPGEPATVEWHQHTRHRTIHTLDRVNGKLKRVTREIPEEFTLLLSQCGHEGSVTQGNPDGCIHQTVWVDSETYGEYPVGSTIIVAPYS